MCECQEAGLVVKHKERWQAMKMKQKAEARLKNIFNVLYQRRWTFS